MSKNRKSISGILALGIGCLAAVWITAFPAHAKTEIEYANNAVISQRGISEQIPFASGIKDVKADGAVTGWTAVIDKADEYVPIGARFANSQAEQAVSVIKVTLPAAAAGKEELMVSLWSPKIGEGSLLNAYRYQNGAWKKTGSKVSDEHISIDMTGRCTDIIMITRAPSFRYKHNPAENPKVLVDAVVNPDAIYGFSPNPASTRLGVYADAIDWTDPDEVAEAKASREEYHEQNAELYRLIEQELSRGSDVETIARAVSRRRNEIRIESYKDNPEGLKILKASNLATYGNEEGPTADSLYKKYGSWQTVIEKAISSNAGMDACLGLYDEYYDVHMLNN